MLTNSLFPAFPSSEIELGCFDSVGRNLIRLDWAELEERLSGRRPKGAAQLELEIASDAKPAAEQLVAA